MNAVINNCYILIFDYIVLLTYSIISEDLHRHYVVLQDLKYVYSKSSFIFKNVIGTGELFIFHKLGS